MADIQLDRDARLMAVVTGGEQRLGRWVCKRLKSHIKLFSLK